MRTLVLDSGAAPKFYKRPNRWISNKIKVVKEGFNDFRFDPDNGTL